MIDQTAQQFSTRSVPWMKLGTVIDEPVTATEAMVLAGLDFDVERRPLGFMNDSGDWMPIGNRSALVDPKTDIHYGIVADGYEVVQYREAFEFIDSIHPEIVAAGKLKSGKQAFMVIKVPDQAHFQALSDDPHDLYVILRTSHDGSKAVEVSLMPLRNMCMNMMPMASFGNRAKQRWSVRHVKTARAQLAEAHNVLTNVEKYHKEYSIVADELAMMSLPQDAAREVLEVVLPDRPRRDEQVSAILALHTGGEFVGHTNTGWGLVNAVGEYFDHLRRGGTPEARMLNALSGITTKMVNHTTQVLMRRRPVSS